ncbi:hypothetical protein ElyMa_004254100 [Elysia marginata]|uniref:Endonuclease/exonuclease/phosphatase domain-containing protein n=1 Tax=Elysia marginata TaxID=1093978 RepID=A0AAV4GTJ1_9GAST|nr:hypothetical protein ElyMa_004254100 [Elysia marginata]
MMEAKRTGKAAWQAYPARLIINGEEVKSVTSRPQPQKRAAPENKKKTKGQLDLRSNCNASVVCWNVHGSLVSKLEGKEFVTQLREHDIVLLSETWTNEESETIDWV